MPIELPHASGINRAPRWKDASRSCDIRDPFNDTKNAASMTRRIRSALSLLPAAPATALAFEAVDTIPYPGGPVFAPSTSAPSTTGTSAAGPTSGFPAYPSDEAARPTNFWAEAGIMYDDNPFRLPDG